MAEKKTSGQDNEANSSTRVSIDENVQHSGEQKINIGQPQRVPLNSPPSRPQNEGSKRNWTSRTQSLPSSSSQCSPDHGICHLILNSFSETAVTYNLNRQSRDVVLTSSHSSSNSTQPETTGNNSGTSSSTDSFCRICQLTRKESEEPIVMAACHCKGGMGRIHRSCLREWVQYRRSIRCEICKQNFEDLSPPTTPSASDFAPADVLAAARRHEAMEQLFMQLQAVRPFSRRKRAAIGAVMIFLAVLTCMTSVMSVKADRQIKRMTKSPYSSKHDVDHASLVFSVCVAVAFFCATITVGLAIIWAVMECCYVNHRRNLLRRAGIRLVATVND